MSTERPSLAAARQRAKEKEGFKDEAGQPLPLHGPLKQLGRGGVGVELFFRTIRLSIGVFTLLFLIAIPALAQNMRTPKEESDSLILATTIGWRTNLCGGARQCPRMWTQVVPWFLITLIIILFMYHIRYLQRTVAKEVDRRYITAGDYAVEVRDLPEHASSEADLVGFFEQFGKVHMVSVGYACGDFVRLERKWKALDLRRNDALARARTAASAAAANGAYSARSTEARAAEERKAAELEAEMVRYEAEMRRVQSEALHPTGAAFLIFETEAGRRACLRAHSLEWYEELFEGCGVTRSRPRYLDRYRLKVGPAPEPSDVYWENLEVGPEQVRKLSVRTTVFSLALIAASAGALIGFNLIKDQQVTRFEGDERLNTARAVSAAAAGAVTAVNAVLKYAVIRLTDIERRDTRTEYEESVYFKLTWAYIINQSLLVLIVGAITGGLREWHEDGGAISQAFYILLANAVLPEVVKVVRVDVLFYRYVLAKLARSQAKLDSYWEPPEATLGEFYAGITKTCSLGLLYGPAMPIAYIITAGALVISYACNKYALLRVFKQPPSINEGLSEQYRAAMGWVVLGSIIMQIIFADGTAQQTLCGWLVAIWAFYKAVPVKWLPFLRLYVDLHSDDTGGRTFSSIAGLNKYSCPIVMPVPTVRPAEAAGSAGLSGVRPQVVQESPPPRPNPVARLGTLGRGGSGAAAAPQPVQPAAQPLGPPRAQATPAPPSPQAPTYPAASMAPAQVAPPPTVVPPQAQYAPPPQAYAQPAPMQPARPPPQPTLLAVTLPPNIRSGMQMLVQDPRTGGLVAVTVPQGIEPGDTFHVSV